MPTTQFLAWLSWMPTRVIWTAELPIQFFAAALGLPDGKAERAVDVPDHASIMQDKLLVKTDVNEQIAIRSQLYSHIRT